MGGPECPQKGPDYTGSRLPAHLMPKGYRMPRSPASRRERLLLALLQLSARLPLPVVRGLGRGLGALLACFPSRARNTTDTNLRLCFPEQSAAERRRLRRRSLMETVTTALEMGPLWFWPVPRLLARIRRVHNEALFRAALADPRGLLLIAPHLGNWELIGLYVSQQASLTTLYQPPRQARLEPVIVAARQRSGARTVPTSRRGVMALFKTLQAGEVVGILPDQEPEPESGVFVPFFGVPALTMRLACQLLAKTGAQALMVVAWRDRTGGGFTLAFEPVDPAIYDSDLVSAAAAMNRSIEALVRQHPEQYQWEYKRFKKRPPGEPKVY